LFFLNFFVSSHDLCEKSFKIFSFCVFGDLNFEINQGEIFGVFGKNGSGKTTLLKILAGIIEPTSGKIEILGWNNVKNLFVGHEPNLYKYLSVKENLELWARLWGKKISENDIKKALEFFEIERFLNHKIFELSQGTRRKVSFSKFLLIEPQIFIVDEPFSNIDDKGKEKLAELFLKAKSEGKTVIFSSPDTNTYLKPDRFIILG
jgi:ABC-type multidrug transport system ATPase subunit